MQVFREYELRTHLRQLSAYLDRCVVLLQAQPAGLAAYSSLYLLTGLLQLYPEDAIGVREVVCLSLPLTFGMLRPVPYMLPCCSLTAASP
jgi:hypothetical protein